MTSPLGGFTPNPYANMTGMPAAPTDDRTLLLEALADTAKGVVSNTDEKREKQNQIKAYITKHIQTTSETKPGSGIFRSNFKHLYTVKSPDAIVPEGLADTNCDEQLRMIAAGAHVQASGGTPQCDTFTLDELMHDIKPTTVNFNPEIPAHGVDGRGNEVFFLHSQHFGTKDLYSKLLDQKEGDKTKPGTHKDPIAVLEDAQSWARSALLSAMLQVPPEELRKTLTAALKTDTHDNTVLINDMVAMATALQDPKGDGLHTLVDENKKPITLTLPGPKGEKGISIEPYIGHLVDNLLRGNSPTRHGDTESHATNVFSLMKALGATAVFINTDQQEPENKTRITAIMTNGAGVSAKASQIPVEDTAGHTELMRSYFDKPILLKVGNGFQIYPTNTAALKGHTSNADVKGEHEEKEPERTVVGDGDKVGDLNELNGFEDRDDVESVVLENTKESR